LHVLVLAAYYTLACMVDLVATDRPVERCFVCGELYEWEALPSHRPVGSPLVFGPTNWQRKPHACPPGAVEAWAEKIARRL
jgi:hypothetical protein